MRCMIQEAGSNGIVDIGWDVESPKWMRFKSSDGKHSSDMRVKSRRIASQGICRVDPCNDKHYYNGHTTVPYNKYNRVSI